MTSSAFLKEEEMSSETAQAPAPTTPQAEPTAAVATATATATPAPATLNPHAKWDLTAKFMKFLDPHLILPLLSFLSDKKVCHKSGLYNGAVWCAFFFSKIFKLIVFPPLALLQLYPNVEILRGRYAVLCKTKLVDLASDVLEELQKAGALTDAEFAAQKAVLSAKRTEVLGSVQAVRELMDPVKALLDDTRLLEAVKQDRRFTAQELEQEFRITPAHMDTVYKFARIQYEIGFYGPALQYIALYGNFTSTAQQQQPPPQAQGRQPLPASTDADADRRRLSTLWGRLACEILMRQWEMALRDVLQLRDTIESMTGSYSNIRLLQMRTELLHWAMFAFFNQQASSESALQESRNAIVEMMFHDRYMNAVQTSCPYLLRYFAVAVVTNKRRRHMLPELARVLKLEDYAYHDPVTGFVQDLVLRADFDAALEKLAEIADGVMANDFFLAPLAREFVESGRTLVFESFMRVHQRVDIATLATKLGMPQDVAERWVVDLIRNSRLDARIDSKINTVMIGSPFQNVYQQVIEKTK
jgi:translation initiation factor 3 subunit E